MKKEIFGEKITKEFLIVMGLSLIGVIFFILNLILWNSDVLNLISIILVVIGPAFREYKR